MYIAYFVVLVHTYYTIDIDNHEILLEDAYSLQSSYKILNKTAENVKIILNSYSST